ncbi:guanylate-binding n-terminal domain containing protein [Stylonychia lemnae]|uniref:Guanylate-binding n-terminal domain containing protein n=1 Tax=Stylonychia lemnae TaxID=5949 RepID=A0A077ZX68_STYLE|nr:guanylate-binding n-terminal domain containing protein [Stylonychia lemnae]|eukprot:CDW74480.1 guanylate-binding n-terminal domain containing protein [Stylonychia lemnae]
MQSNFSKQYSHRSGGSSSQQYDSVDLSQFPDEPIQFIQIDDKGKCKINHSAFDMLSKITTKIAIICVAGPYRTGKSFLLNRLLGKQDGFEIGSTVQSCTKGLWIWGRPIRVSQDMHAILLDTEGLGSCNRDQVIDIKIFSLSVLLSSYFVFNCMNAIDENALEALSLVCNLSKHIHVNSKPSNLSDDQGANMARYFPQFMWVIRDFALQMVDDNDNEINPKQYLENALRPVEVNRELIGDNGVEIIKRKNEIRQVLQTMFQERDCTVLFRPVSDEKKLREINNLPYDSLRPQFRMQLEGMVKKIFYNLRPKLLEGQTLSGKMFCELADCYVQAMNSDAVPTISSAWERVIDGEIKRIYELALEQLNQYIQEVILQRFPLEELELRQLMKEGKQKSLTILNSLTIANSPPEKLIEMRQAYDDKLEQIFDIIQQNNYTASEKVCEDLFLKFHEQIRQKVQSNEFEDFKQLQSDWDIMRKFYKENARGPAKFDISERLGINRLLSDCDQLFFMIKSEQDKQYMELKQKYQVAQGLQDSAKEMLKEEKEKNQQLVREIREKGQETRLEYESRIDELRLELNKKDDQIRRLEFEIEKQAKLAQIQIQQNAIQQMNVMNSQEGSIGGGALSNLDQSDVKGILKLLGQQLQTKEFEIQRLKLTKEYELKMKDLEKIHYERLQLTKQETRRAFDITMENMKTIYEDEIKSLKQVKKDGDEKINNLKRELVKKEGDIQLLQERIKGQEKEKNLKLEHAQLLCKLSNALKGYADAIDSKAKQHGGSGMSISNGHSNSNSKSTSQVRSHSKIRQSRRKVDDVLRNKNEEDEDF